MGRDGRRKVDEKGGKDKRRWEGMEGGEEMVRDGRRVDGKRGKRDERIRGDG